MEWISIKERLPEDEGVVLAYVGFPINDFDLAWRDDEGNWYLKSWLRGYEGSITHWMDVKPPSE